MKTLFILCSLMLSSAAFSNVAKENAHAEKLQQWMQKIENGSAKSAYDLAQHYMKQRKMEQAEQWLKHAALLGYGPAAITLARHYEAEKMMQPESDVTSRDVQHYGQRLLEYGEQKNDPESLYVLGEYYQSQEKPVLKEKGDELMRRAAGAGHKEAMLIMAEDAFSCCANNVTGNGISALQAPAEGLYWLRGAAKKGSSKAWLYLAEYYMGMMGDQVNHEKATYALQQAVTMGQPTAMMYAALEDFRASPSVLNLVKAKKMLRKSAELGVQQSARYLSFIDTQNEASE